MIEALPDPVELLVDERVLLVVVWVADVDLATVEHSDLVDDQLLVGLVMLHLAVHYQEVLQFGFPLLNSDLIHSVKHNILKNIFPLKSLGIFILVESGVDQVEGDLLGESEDLVLVHEDLLFEFWVDEGDVLNVFLRNFLHIGSLPSPYVQVLQVICENHSVIQKTPWTNEF